MKITIRTLIVVLVRSVLCKSLSMTCHKITQITNKVFVAMHKVDVFIQINFILTVLFTCCILKWKESLHLNA